MGLRDRLKIIRFMDNRKQAKFEALREADKEVIENTIYNLKNYDLLEALRETGETNEIENQVALSEIDQLGKFNKNIFNEVREEKKGFRESITDWRKRRLEKKIDLTIRRICRKNGYYSLENSEYENAEIYAKAKDTVIEMFNKYNKQLNKLFTPEEKAGLYFDKLSIEAEFDMLRKGELSLGDIKNLMQKDLEYGPDYSDFISFHNIIKEKQIELELRRSNKEIATEHDIEISEDVVWGQEKKITARDIKGDVVWGEGRPVENVSKIRITEKDINGDEVWGNGRPIYNEENLQITGHNSPQDFEKESFEKNNIGLQAYLNRIADLRHEANKLNSSNRDREAMPTRNIAGQVSERR